MRHCGLDTTGDKKVPSESGRSASLNRLSVYLETRDVNVTAGTVAAARDQVGKTDLVDLTEINRLAHPGGCILCRAVCPLRYNTFDVEFHPALGGKHELG